MRPRTIDAEAYKTEQEAWRSWNEMHLDSEAEFNALRTLHVTAGCAVTSEICNRLFTPADFQPFMGLPSRASRDRSRGPYPNDTDARFVPTGSSAS